MHNEKKQNHISFFFTELLFQCRFCEERIVHSPFFFIHLIDHHLPDDRHDKEAN